MGSGCVGETGRSLSPNCAVGDRVHVAGSPGVLTPRETRECLVLSCFQPKGTSLGVREACRKESTVVWVGLPSNSGFLPPPLPLIRGNPRCLNWRPFLCVEYQGIPCLLSRKFSPFRVVRCGGGASPKSVLSYAFVLRHPFLLVSTFFCKQPIPFFAPFSFSLSPYYCLPMTSALSFCVMLLTASILLVPLQAASAVTLHPLFPAAASLAVVSPPSCPPHLRCRHSPR